MFRLDNVNMANVLCLMFIYISLYSSKNDSNQTNRKEQKQNKKLDSEHNIENTVTYTPT